MQYPTLTVEDGRTVLERLRLDPYAKPVQPPARWIGSGMERFDVEMVDDLADAFRSVRKRFVTDGNEEAKGPWAKIEGLLGAEVHGILKDVPKFVMSDPQFWIWVVFGSPNEFLSKAVNLRHSRSAGEYDALPENYGITSQLEAGFWSRVWMRGEIGFDPARNDPYELATRGDQDFWRSHLLRQDFASVRKVAHAFILFQFPDEHPDQGRVGTQTIRAMAKELRRRHATIGYEFLDAEGARRLIEEVHASVLAQ